MKFQKLIPDFYQALLNRDLLGLSINETKATCNDCAMACHNRKTNQLTYDATLKCCTYQPFIPNFAIGGILADPALPGHHRVKKFIAQNHFSLPLGIVPPISFQVEFNAREKIDFGNRFDWLCPYYDFETSACGVWTYRSSVCTSFYCLSSYGSGGLQFWQAIENYLSYAEMALMEECLVNLDFSPRQVSELTLFLNRHNGSQHELMMKNLPEKQARLLWNFYFDEQELFFAKCLNIVSNMTRKEFLCLIGPTGESLEQKVIASAKKISL